MAPTPGPAALMAFVLASCAGPGGDGEPERAGPPCEPSSSLELRAEGLSFGTRCLAVPADRAVPGTLEGLDLEPHNFALYLEEPGPNQQDLSAPNLLVRSETTFPGEEAVIEIPRLREGAYFFRCDFHPAQMAGTLHAVR
ncbi:MAG: hypothetical protein ACRDHV_08020 [Actinomycetota bacterium]